MSQALLTKLKSLTSTRSETKSESGDGYTVEQEFAQVKADAALATWVKDQYQTCKDQRAQYQRKWEYNLLNYAGEQWVNIINGASQMFKTPPAPSYRQRLATNLIRPMVRQQITRMTNTKPTANVVPVSTSDDDLFAAQGGQAVWDSLYSRKKFQSKMVRAAFWTVVTGNGYMKTYWDRNAIDRNFLAVNPMLEKPQPTVGDIEYGVVTPFNLFVPDLLIEDIEDQSYIIEAYTKPVLWVNTFWKDYLKHPVDANCSGKNEIFESSYWMANNDKTAAPDSVLVIEIIMKGGAHPNFPNGGMLTVVGDQIAQRIDQMPYSHGEYCIAQWGDVPTGKFYCDSILNDTIPLNRQYNRTRNQMIESMIRTGRTQIMYTEGSVNPNRITSRPGELISVKPGYNMPQPLPANPIPAFVTDELRILKGDIEDISGQHAVSKGQGPGGGVIAATAINFIQELDDSMYFTTYASGEAMVEKIARHSLSIVADYWDIPRIVRNIGTDAAFDAVELKGSQIANGLDIRVESGSMLPNSKTAKQALLMDLAKLGFITPQQLFDLLEMGGTKRLTELIRVDMYKAQRENLKMKKLDPMMIEQANAQYEQSLMPDEFGNVDENTFNPATGQTLTRPLFVPVDDFDDHRVHIEVHNRYRKSPEFELLDPMVKKEFADHILQHQVQLMFSMQQQMGAQAGMQPPGMAGPEMMPFEEQFGGEQNGDKLGEQFGGSGGQEVQPQF